MAIERTFSMIKPDATKRNLTGAITKVFEDNGLRVVASKRVWMSKREAEGFYAVHKERPFFGELVEGMTSGPTIVQVLEGENAILKNREIMGATNPANAAEGTIRKLFALSVGENSVHGSDAPETAAQEIKFFFTDDEIVGAFGVDVAERRVLAAGREVRDVDAVAVERGGLIVKDAGAARAVRRTRAVILHVAHQCVLCGRLLGHRRAGAALLVANLEHLGLRRSRARMRRMQRVELRSVSVFRVGSGRCERHRYRSRE